MQTSTIFKGVRMSTILAIFVFTLSRVSLFLSLRCFICYVSCRSFSNINLLVESDVSEIQTGAIMQKIEKKQIEIESDRRKIELRLDCRDNELTASQQRC